MSQPSIEQTNKPKARKRSRTSNLAGSASTSSEPAPKKMTSVPAAFGLDEDTQMTALPPLRQWKPTTTFDVESISRRISCNDHRIEQEGTRLLDERTFPLTRSGHKYVCICVDPTFFNERMLKINHRLYSSSVSFNTSEFEEFLTVLPRLLQSIKDVPEEDSEDKYEKIADLSSYDVIQLPHRVVKFRHTSLSSIFADSLCFAEDTIRVFEYMGLQFLTKLMELREIKFRYPQMEHFTNDIATKMGPVNNFQELSDTVVFEVIREYYNDNYFLYELYSKFYYTVHKEVQRKTKHMFDYNNYNF